mgnify:CR=1 FL=1
MKRSVIISLLDLSFIVPFIPSISNAFERDRQLRNEVMREQGPCGKSSCPGYEVDHIKPLYQGGTDTRNNLQVLRKDIHQQKTAQDWKAWKANDSNGVSKSQRFYSNRNR